MGYSIRLAVFEDMVFLTSVERQAGALFKTCLVETGLTAAAFDHVVSSDDLDRRNGASGRTGRPSRTWQAGPRLAPRRDRVRMGS